MNIFITLFFFIQVCLVQNTFSQCTSRTAVAVDPALISPGHLGAPFGTHVPFPYDGLYARGAAPYGYPGYSDIPYPGLAYPELAPYGGVGEGNVAVAGELPVAGTTVVAGQVPIMGAVKFCGEIPAAGAVNITGKCACGCRAPYEYLY